MKQTGRDTHGPARLAAALLVGLLAMSGCGQKQGLRPHMLDAEYEAVLAEKFAAGMTPDEVHARLDEMNVAHDQRRWYPDSGICVGGQLLARVYEPGGRWIDQDDATIKWVDTWFVFGSPGPGGPLLRWYIHRGNQRYFQGEPIYGPPESETLGPTRRYPFPPPLPARPPA